MIIVILFIHSPYSLMAFIRAVSVVVVVVVVTAWQDGKTSEARCYYSCTASRSTLCTGFVALQLWRKIMSSELLVTSNISCTISIFDIFP